MRRRCYRKKDGLWTGTRARKKAKNERKKDVAYSFLSTFSSSALSFSLSIWLSLSFLPPTHQFAWSRCVNSKQMARHKRIKMCGIQKPVQKGPALESCASANIYKHKYAYSSTTLRLINSPVYSRVVINSQTSAFSMILVGSLIHRSKVNDRM